MYTLVTFHDKDIIRGASTTAKSLRDNFPNKFQVVNSERNYSLLSDLRKTSTLIILKQTPYLVGWTPISGKHDIVFLRKEYDLPEILDHTCTNGLSYYYSSKTIKNFIPIIPNMNIPQGLDIPPCIGFYNYPTIKQDSTSAFLSFIKTIPKYVNILIMGMKIPGLSHTYNNVEFFSKITHYFYFKSKKFIDPLPNSLIEAIQTKKIIICPNSDRPFMDGIDDVLTCIPNNYFNTFINKDYLYEYDNSLLLFERLVPFYNYLIQNNFYYVPNTKIFSEFLEKEI